MTFRDKLPARSANLAFGLAVTWLSACASQSGGPAAAAPVQETAAPPIASRGAPRTPGESVTFPFAETFEGLEPGSAPMGFRQLGDERATTTIVAATKDPVIQPKSGERMLQLADDSTEDAAELTLDLPDNKRGSVQYSFLTPSDRPGDSYMTLGVGTNSDGRVVDILFSSGGTLRYRSAGGSLVDVADYSQDEWHDVVVMWDTEAASFHLFLDEVRLGTFPVVREAVPTNLTFKVGSNAKSSQAAYVDDVQVLLE